MKKYNEIPNEIKMPVYWVMLNDDGEVDEENGTPVFDLDAMAEELTDRVSIALGLDTHISILQNKEEK